MNIKEIIFINTIYDDVHKISSGKKNAKEEDAVPRHPGKDLSDLDRQGEDIINEYKPRRRGISRYLEGIEVQNRARSIEDLVDEISGKPRRIDDLAAESDEGSGARRIGNQASENDHQKTRIDEDQKDQMINRDKINNSEIQKTETFSYTDEYNSGHNQARDLYQEIIPEGYGVRDVHGMHAMQEELV